MKRNIMICGAAAVVLVLAGCSKEPVPVMPDANEKVTLTLDAATTKTSLDGNKIRWTEGDRINVNGIPYAVEIAADGSATVEVVKAASYKAIYPAENFTPSAPGNTPDTLQLDPEQSYAEGTFANGSNPMVAYTNNENPSLRFHSICGVVKLSLTGDNIAISRIEVWDAAQGGKMGGNFTLSGIESSSPVLSGGTTDSVSLDFLSYDQPVLTSEPMDFHIVVPARTYTDGFVVKVVTDDGDVIEKTSQANTEVLASDIVAMPVFEVIPPVQTVYFAADGGSESTELPETIVSKLSVRTDAGSVIKKSMMTRIGDLVAAATDPIDLDMGQADFYTDELSSSDWNSAARKKVRSLVVPKNIKTMGTFIYQSSTLEKVELPATVTELSSMTFYNCSALATLVFKSAAPPKAGSSAFNGMGKNVDEADRKIYVPDAAVEAYKTAEYWSKLVEGEGTKYMKYTFIAGSGE